MPVTEQKPEDKEVQNEEVDELEAPNEVIDPEPLLEPEGAPDPDPKKGAVPHPLTPGGRRFEQVYAESKQAKRDLVQERELRIAAEAKLSVLEHKGPATSTGDDPEYDWPQLEEFIQQGRITRADAQAHREKVIEKRLARSIKGEFTQEVTTANRSQALQVSIQKYIDAIPAIMTEGSDERERLESEFEFLASVQGIDHAKMTDSQRKALQLTALRTVHGPIDSLVKRSEKPKGETHQGLPGGTRPRPSTNPDQALLDGLTKREVVHYNKMFRAGRYPGGWKDVVAELKFDRKSPKASR